MEHHPSVLGSLARHSRDATNSSCFGRPAPRQVDARPLPLMRLRPPRHAGPVPGMWDASLYLRMKVGTKGMHMLCRDPLVREDFLLGLLPKPRVMERVRRPI